MAKIYLASRYSRQEELRNCAAQLTAIGYKITSRWLYGDHQISDDGLSEKATEELRIRWALEDFYDVQNADIVISFTEMPRSDNSRGARHVEFGMALALKKRLIVVGHKENIFHCLPQVDIFPDWKSCFDRLSEPHG